MWSKKAKMCQTRIGLHTLFFLRGDPRRDERYVHRRLSLGHAKQGDSSVGGEGARVIVGRCADYILRERDDCFHVFVHADLGTRAQRIVRLYGESEKSPEKRLEEKDRKRRLYYRHYTDREWGMSQNYHLSLDSGLIGGTLCGL